MKTFEEFLNESTSNHTVNESRDNSLYISKNQIVVQPAVDHKIVFKSSFDITKTDRDSSIRIGSLQKAYNEQVNKITNEYKNKISDVVSKLEYELKKI